MDHEDYFYQVDEEYRIEDSPNSTIKILKFSWKGRTYVAKLFYRIKPIPHYIFREHSPLNVFIEFKFSIKRNF